MCELREMLLEMISIVSDWSATSVVSQSHNVQNLMRQDCEFLLVYYNAFPSGVGCMGQINANSFQAVGQPNFFSQGYQVVKIIMVLS